jgi:hypothetical protein
VVGSIVYDPHQREFNVELLSVDKWIKDDGLQAVFIPDFADGAIPLATQLRIAHPDVALLGSNGWNDPGALGRRPPTSRGGLRRRLLPEQHASRHAGVRRGLPRRVRRRDAGDPRGAGLRRRMLVARTLQEGARSRLQVAQALQRPRTIEGAAGAIGILPQGIQRQLFLLKLSNGTISEIAPGRISSVPPARRAAGAAGFASAAPSTRTERPERGRVRCRRHGGPRDRRAARWARSVSSACWRACCRPCRPAAAACCSGPAMIAPSSPRAAAPCS